MLWIDFSENDSDFSTELFDFKLTKIEKQGIINLNN